MTRYLCERPRDGRDLLEPVHTGNAHAPGDCLICDADRELAIKLQDVFIHQLSQQLALAPVVVFPGLYT